MYLHTERENETSITKKELKDLLILCTKNVHFFNGQLYLQKQEIAMGSPLGPVIAGIFMIELEKNVIPMLSQSMTSWKSYVDDSMISFLDVLTMKKNNTIETTVYRKQTHNDIYLHWQSFTQETWKRDTLKTLYFRAHTICSNKELLEKEVKHLKHVFITINGFPLWVVSQVINRVENGISTSQINQSIVNPEPLNVKQHKLILPYKGKNGEHTLKNLKRLIAKLLPEQEGMALVFTGTKLGSKFNIKDKTSTEH